MHNQQRAFIEKILQYGMLAVLLLVPFSFLAFPPVRIRLTMLPLHWLPYLRRITAKERSSSIRDMAAMTRE